VLSIGALLSVKRSNLVEVASQESLAQQHVHTQLDLTFKTINNAYLTYTNKTTISVQRLSNCFF